MKYKIPLKRENWPLFGFVGLFAVIGTILLSSSHAATPYISLNAGSGTLGGNASFQTDASNGTYVKFGGASTGGGGGGTGSPWIGLNGFNNWGGTYGSPYGGGSTTYQDLFYKDGFRWARLGALECTQYAPLPNPLPAQLNSCQYDTYLINSALAAGINLVIEVPTTTTPANNSVSDAMSWMQQYKSWGSRVLFEFGNEPFYNGVSASSYATAYQTAYNQKHAAGITQPLIFMTAGALTSAGYWLDQSLSAVPNLQIDAFSAHTYGEVGDDDNGDSNGVVALNNLHSEAVKRGFVNQPWYVTEYGFTLCQPVSQNSCPTSSSTPKSWYVPSYYQQEEQLILGYNAMMAYGDGQSGTWLKGIMWYQTHDDGTGDFGLVTDQGTATDNAGEQVGNQPSHDPICLRPAYTALKDFLTSNNINPSIAVNQKAPACK